MKDVDSPTSLTTDHWAKIFHTAMISSHHYTRFNFEGSGADQLKKLMATPAFQLILECCEVLSEKKGIPPQQAAEEMIQTFREIEQLWTRYVYQEGLSKILASEED